MSPSDVNSVATASAERNISAAILRIRATHPFFGVLALFAELRLGDETQTAATDGKCIYLNTEYCSGLTPSQLSGLLLHEILHCALEHVSRRGTRELLLWNVAADIVVNGMIRGACSFELPQGSVENPSLASLSAEEIYARLCQTGQAAECKLPDLLSAASWSGGALEVNRRSELAAHWRMARNNAMTVARKHGQQFGNIGGKEWRELQLLAAPEVDWRTLLWEYLARTPTDYSGFDRRFVGQGLYLETLEGESLDLWVAVDTSGSISGQELKEFLSEVAGILDAYPRIRGKLYFADTDLYGPFDVSADQPMPAAKGGGGTSFRPFFTEIQKEQERASGEPIAVYFTDGYGEFPTTTPEAEVLWVVTNQGLGSGSFPFGTVIRLK